MTRRRAVGAATLAALAFVAGCSGGGGAAAPSTGTGGSGGSTTSAPDVPVVGGTLRLGIARLDSLDPAAVSPESVSASIAADLLFDGLTELRDGDQAAQPGLASSWSSPDGGLTWRFALRTDARFSDGSAITATDVVQSIDRVVQRTASSPIGSRLAGLAGYDAFVQGSATDLPGVAAVDPATVQLTFASPFATAPELLAGPTFGVVPATFDPNAPAITSGPYRYGSTDGDVVHLVRVAGGSAYVDAVDLHQYDDVADAYDAFDAGDLDWSLVPASRVDAAADAHGVDGFRSFQAELFYGFNLQDPTFADVRFRQAIVQAVDRQAVVRAVYFGIAEPLETLIPDGVVGHDAARCGDGCRYDPDAARALLAAAFPDGTIPEVFIDFDEGADESAVAGVLQQDLQAVGITATLRPHPVQDFNQVVSDRQGALLRLGWVGASPTGDAYLGPLFQSASPDNLTALNDPNVDLLLAAVAGAVDPATRAQALGSAESAILALAPVLPLAQFQVLSVASPEVHDLDLAVNGTFDPEAVWLAP